MALKSLVGQSKKQIYCRVFNFQQTDFLSVCLFNCPFCLFVLTVFSVVTVITVHTVLTVLFVFFCPLSVCLSRLSYFLSFCLSFRLVLLEAVGDISRLSKVTLSLSLSSREKEAGKAVKAEERKAANSFQINSKSLTKL